MQPELIDDAPMAPPPPPRAGKDDRLGTVPSATAAFRRSNRAWNPIVTPLPSESNVDSPSSVVHDPPPEYNDDVVRMAMATSAQFAGVGADPLQALAPSELTPTLPALGAGLGFASGAPDFGAGLGLPTMDHGAGLGLPNSATDIGGFSSGAFTSDFGAALQPFADLGGPALPPPVAGLSEPFEGLLPTAPVAGATPQPLFESSALSAAAMPSFGMGFSSSFGSLFPGALPGAANQAGAPTLDEK